MERIIRLHIEKLPEGVYLATSDDIQGLVVQGGTVGEVIEYAEDAVRMLRELRAAHGIAEDGIPVPERFDHTLVLAA